jgi:hypothetical protein
MGAAAAPADRAAAIKITKRAMSLLASRVPSDQAVGVADAMLQVMEFYEKCAPASPPSRFVPPAKISSISSAPVA